MMRATILTCASVLLLAMISSTALPLMPVPAHTNKTVQSLTKEDYFTFKLFRGKTGQYYYVKLKYDTDEDCVFLINTNQSFVSIDLLYAQNRETNIHERAEPILNAYGESKPAYTATGFAISKGFTTLQKSNPGIIYDMSREINDRFDLDGVRYQGVIGNDMLTNNGAIIDYENEELHLLTPHIREKRLNGVWDSASMEYEGNSEDYKDLRIEFDGRGGWTWQKKSSNLFCVGSCLLYPRVHPKQMWCSLLDPSTRTNDKLDMIYAIEGDTLKLSGGLKDGVECKERPTTFKTKPGDKHATVTFQRRKAKDK
jgi:uncharacterized protein (TIGR03067 family)